MEENESIVRPLELIQEDGYWVGRFSAMASPCEILIAVEEEEAARNLTEIAAHEAWRIEQKFSRYRDDGIVALINSSSSPVKVDAETAHLLDFAYQCFELSDGLFDITSGILRKVWRFDGGSQLPSTEDVKSLLHFVGLGQASWNSPEFYLPSGMQIDFGGIGKEYAVDKVLGLLRERLDAPMLVNFGGDIATNRFREHRPWLVGVENPIDDDAQALLEIRSGGLATSGSSHRYIVNNGRRYSHVLNPLTGWPVEGPPLSVTVAASNCTMAGMLATYAMLQGENAESYLEEQGVRFWAIR
ncbi:MAG: FAD:protein FMN transferase [Halioglobus sp.]